MRIGFTGTRHGCTDAQRRRLVHELTYAARHEGAYAAHHGDCVGADAEFHDIARDLGLHIVGHPPIFAGKRAFKRCDELREPKAYLPRDRDIVDETDWLVATPAAKAPSHGSGTWYTIGYAEKKRKPILIIHHDGSTQRLNDDVE